MLYWTLSFLFLALVAALYGFTGIAGGATVVAQVIFLVFIVLFAVSLAWTLVSGQQTRTPQAVRNPN